MSQLLEGVTSDELAATRSDFDTTSGTVSDQMDEASNPKLVAEPSSMPTKDRQKVRQVVVADEEFGVAQSTAPAGAPTK